jgi:predicted AlkP superfamily pyrophosphatase or phosphodiesterase
VSGHVFGPDSHKQRVAVRRFDSVLEKLLIELRDQNATEAVNVVIASDHGMAAAGVKIELSKYLDMNDVDQLVGSDTFVMMLPEAGKEDFVSVTFDSEV